MRRGGNDDEDDENDTNSGKKDDNEKEVTPHQVSKYFISILISFLRYFYFERSLSLFALSQRGNIMEGEIIGCLSASAIGW